MKQSTVIFGALVFGFVVYITLRGQLPAYLGLFNSSKTSVASGGNADKTPTSNSNPNPFGEFGQYVPQPLLDMFSQMGI